MVEETKLDMQQQRDGRDLLLSAISDTGRYMAAAIRYANRKAGVTDQDFWKGLFVPTGNRESDQLMRQGRDGDPASCPEDPYGKLDVQACNKYLLFGGQRTVIRDNRPVKLTDSENFFKTFRMDRQGYSTVLWSAIDLRNKSAHNTGDWEAGLTADSIRRWLETLQELTDPLRRVKEPWYGSLEPLDEYWKRKKQRCTALLGTEPLELEALGQELFLCDALTPGQRNALNQAVKWCNLDYRNGRVYREEKRKLMDKLRSVPAVAALLGAVPQPAQKAAPGGPTRTKERVEAISRAPVNPAAAALLTRAGSTIPLLSNYVSALLDSFVPLVDESVFLSAEGRTMLTESLAPRLMERREQLLVDESVVTALFRKFRGSAAYTELELQELPAEERDAAQKWRQEVHHSSKTAVKVLRDLRKRQCLTVVASPTDSERSYDNLWEVARMNPGVRFLVLTMDRDLAEELGSLPQHNAAAGKPNIDGDLLLFRATREAYLSMLERQMPPIEAAAPETAAVQTARAGEKDYRLLAGAQPKSGSRLLAVGPDGVEQRCTLGASLGSGGEGTIYATSDPDVVAKVYFERQLTRERMEKLQAMLRSDPHIARLCWPTAMLYAEGGAWVGYLMPKARGRELAQTVFHPGRNNASLTKQGWTRRSLAEIAANVAAVFERMHAQGILMGDVNPRNFMVTQDCQVSLVDCDSYQFGGYRCPVGTPLYTPPEVHKRMRADGRENYGYERTVENERYSLAVLLFEILMLGKPPYESRNTNNADVVQAIITGDFPYPYHSDDEDQKAAANGLQAPVGRWRQIWSHMTYQVKTDFYNTFTNHKRLSAGEWEKSMREYARMIELDRSSDELMPNGYKVVTDVDDATAMVNLVCEECHRPFNMAKDLYERRKANGERTLCNDHWELMQKIYRRRMHQARCTQCGRMYELSVAKWIELDRSGKPLLCPECFSGQFTTVTCSQCGKSYRMKTDRWNELRASGKPVLCQDCLNASRTTVTCSRCGKQFQMWNDTLQRRRQYGDDILCPDCKTYRR